MRILFLNQYFPPDPAPTGILFAEIAAECRARGHETVFVDAQQDYRTAAQHQKGGRMKRELAALRRMLQAGKAQPRAEVVISGSSPPCLAVFAERVARHHRARHLHWAMDVYPEIASALGEIRDRSLIARFTGWLMGRAYRRSSAVVGLDADMATVLGRHRVNAVTIRPWVFGSLLAAVEQRPSPGDSVAASFTCLYSGNLGRAHDFETLLYAQQILEGRSADVSLRFQGGGPNIPAAQALALRLGLQRCAWAPYVPEEALVASLLENHVLAVTQRPETQGLLWPSKLGLITALPRPILFIGPTDGAIAADLRQYGHAGIFRPGEAEAIADWLEAQRKSAPSITRLAAPAQHRADALSAWIRLIEQN